MQKEIFYQKCNEKATFCNKKRPNKAGQPLRIAAKELPSFCMCLPPRKRKHTTKYQPNAPRTSRLAGNGHNFFFKYVVAPRALQPV